MQSTTTNFMILADPQLGLGEFRKRRDAGGDPAILRQRTDSHPSEWADEMERLNRAIDIANALKPDFVAVLGDMVMQWNDDRQLHSINEAFSRLSPEIPLHRVSGNHDIGVDFLSPTTESLDRYRKNHGPDRYSFVSGNCRFIVINSSLLDSPEMAQQEAAVHLRWLEQELAASTAGEINHTVILSHHPPFLRNISGDDGVYSMRPGRRQIVDLLEKYGVEYMFAGHAHGNFIARHNRLRVIVTTALALPQPGHRPGYRLVRVRPEGLSHAFHLLD
ncbi:MAG: metallophosphoesterase [Chloroflexi bacterium]|nr:metallophosphoesterase [Chloroflexota bacterium]